MPSSVKAVPSTDSAVKQFLYYLSTWKTNHFKGPPKGPTLSQKSQISSIHIYPHVIHNPLPYPTI